MPDNIEERLKKLSATLRARQIKIPRTDYYTSYILILNFQSEEDELIFDDFKISKVTPRNYKQYREIFPCPPLYRNGTLYVIERIFKNPPPLPEDVSEDSADSIMGGIPFAQEDLMFFLRLYKHGDIVFLEQRIIEPDGTNLVQYRYPTVFSNYHSTFYYRIFSTDIPLLNTFKHETPSMQGWNSKWLKIAKRYFLWGGSKEFHPGRDNERILDYMIAVEAVLVYEGDFVSRRLRERAARIINGLDEQKNAVKELINKFYGFRSTLAHGNNLSSPDVSYITANRILFEDTVREILKMIIRYCPSDSQEREQYLKSLFDITEQDRADKILSDFQGIRNDEIKKSILEQIKNN